MAIALKYTSGDMPWLIYNQAMDIKELSQAMHQFVTAKGLVCF